MASGNLIKYFVTGFPKITLRATLLYNHFKYFKVSHIELLEGIPAFLRQIDFIYVNNNNTKNLG